MEGLLVFYINGDFSNIGVFMKINIVVTTSLLLAMVLTYSCSSGNEELSNVSSNAAESSGPAVPPMLSRVASGDLPDSRDGKTYKTVIIGTQNWMAENLNYDVAGSKCYGNLASNCNKYGRLYNWAMAMALPDSCNRGYSCLDQINDPHQGICPTGWHIPKMAEFERLFSFAGGIYTAGKHLKATSGWNGNGNGLDTYGFAALPGGEGYGSDYFDAGYYGSWWTANAGAINYNAWNLLSSDNQVRRENVVRGFFFSVRCVEN
jgi:uncharacterized protein (TIGR02145 family)